MYRVTLDVNVTGFIQIGTMFTDTHIKMIFPHISIYESIQKPLFMDCLKRIIVCLGFLASVIDSGMSAIADLKQHEQQLYFLPYES